MTRQEQLRLKKIARAVLIVPGVFAIILGMCIFVKWDWTWLATWNMGDRALFLVFWIAGSAGAIALDNTK